MKNSIKISGWITTDYDDNLGITTNKEGRSILSLAETIESLYTSDDCQPSTIGECDDEMGGVSLYIPNCMLKYYISDNEISLENVEEKSLAQLCGGIDIFGENYGYSAWTIMGFDVEKLMIGEHDLENILSEQRGKYINMVIEY